MRSANCSTIMTLKTPVFLSKLQIFANQSFIIICKNGGDVADLAVETVQTVLPARADDQLKTLINDFLIDLEISRRSPHTITNYRSDLGRFQKFIVEQGRPLDIVLIRTSRPPSTMPNCLVKPSGMNWTPSRAEKRGHGDPKEEGALSAICGKA